MSRNIAPHIGRTRLAEIDEMRRNCDAALNAPGFVKGLMLNVMPVLYILPRPYGMTCDG